MSGHDAFTFVIRASTADFKAAPFARVLISNSAQGLSRLPASVPSNAS